jgi:hypothetical protein
LWFLVQGGVMSACFDNNATELMTTALRNALERLRMLGLVDGDADRASVVLTELIADAMERGEQDRENLVLYAIGRFQSDKPASGH